MVSSLQAKVSQLEAAAGGGGECPECGGPDDPDHTTYELVFLDEAEEEAEEEWCETCGRQTAIVIRWPEDLS